MPQSLAQVYLHIVFSTKDRQPFLRDDDLRQRTHQYLGGICRKLKCPSLKIGGIEDHVHIGSRFARTITVADFIQRLKQDSTSWLKGEGLTGFRWQAGYAAFSVSPSHVDALTEYIANQEEHHKREPFQDELRRLFRKYKIEYDERYVWD